MEENNYDENYSYNPGDYQNNSDNNVEGGLGRVETEPNRRGVRSNTGLNDKNGQSTAALVLSSVSLGLGVCCCSAMIPLICGIIGLVLAIPLMKNNPNDIKARLAVTFSAIGIGISAIKLLIAFLYLIAGIFNGDLYDIFYDFDRSIYY
ncbi:MAG: hypothetical protein J1F01_02660 [Oscillospiraceae bacterium]|nr:hypothetical protein [Oscillospiraceae bacterium]